MSDPGGEVLADGDRRLAERLARATELLRADKLDEAAQALAEATRLRPGDLRARNLEGLLLFRAGRHEEARAVYLELCAAHPLDAALRLNLGLVELRLGHHLQAAENLGRVVAAEPGNARAQGYLGLALMRAGALPAARDAFHKAGQEELAQQVEERMAQLGDEATGARLELRRAVHEGARALEAEQPFAAVELEPPLEEARRVGAWQVRAAGERAPLPAPEGPPTWTEPPSVTAAQPVAAFATARLLRAGAEGEPFAVAASGMLLVRVDGRVQTRTAGAVASSGQLSFEPLFRRLRGQVTEEPFGEGTDAMLQATGQGLVVVAPRGAVFHALVLADDAVYVRETALFAFEESLHWENGRVPAGGSEAMRVVQFRGTGRLVLRAARPLFTLKIGPDAPLYVEAAALLGWIGRVVPRVLAGQNGDPSPYVACTGEGVILIEEPAASAARD